MGKLVCRHPASLRFAASLAFKREGYQYLAMANHVYFSKRKKRHFTWSWYNFLKTFTNVKIGTQLCFQSQLCWSPFPAKAALWKIYNGQHAMRLPLANESFQNYIKHERLYNQCSSRRTKHPGLLKLISSREFHPCLSTATSWFSIPAKNMNRPRHYTKRQK